MFRWRKEMERLEIPAARVLRLQRSLSDVQVALPGLPPQEATAYLCAFAAGKGVQVAVALQLHLSRRLAFYLSEAEAGEKEAGRVLKEGVCFAESMGFVLGDLDVHLLDGADRTALWDSLPLRTGGREPEPGAEGPVAVSDLPAAGPGAAGACAQEAVPSLPTPAEKGAPVCGSVPATEEAGEEVVSLEEALVEPLPSPPAAASVPAAAVSPGERLRPSTPPARRPVSAGEMAARRRRFLENLGRFLASL